ncbi:hypothetical protein ACTFIU_011476 [Dictyostelium citrinum]
MTNSEVTNNSQTVAVTGATGFVGTYVVRDLLAKNYKVLALVRDPNNQEKLKTLKSFDDLTNPRLSFSGGELENVDYDTVLNGVDYVIHTASPFIYTAEDVQKEIINPAINGTVAVLKAASKIKSIKKVIVTSSGLAVVDLTNTEKNEFNDDDWASPPISNPYAYSKVEAEKAAWEFMKENEKDESTNHFKLVVMNPTFILGPALSTLINSSVGSIIKQLFNAMPPPPISIGIINVQDVSTAHILALESEKADNKRITINESVVPFKKFIEVAMKQFPQFKYNTNIPNLPEEPHSYKLRSNRLIDELGFKSFIPLDETIKTMIEHLLSNGLIKPELV